MKLGEMQRLRWYLGKWPCRFGWHKWIREGESIVPPWRNCIATCWDCGKSELTDIPGEYRQP